MDVSVSRAGVNFAQELTMKDFDGAIVGAGPAGSATAIALAQRGYAVLLVDKQQFPREKLCGDFVNPINWPIFRKLRVEQRILAQPHAAVTGFRISSYSGVEAEAPFSSTAQQPEFGLGMRREQLDQVLLERARSLGVTVHLGRRIENLARSAQGWRLQSSGDESWQARILIGADGRNSWVAQRLGMNTRMITRGRCVGFQFRLQSPAAVAGKVEIHLFRGGYAGLIGLGDRTINLCLSIDKRMLPSERVGEFLLTQCLPRNPYLKKLLDRRTSTGECRSAYPVYFHRRRGITNGALLVGDAARVSEPVTGEGIYFAMQSGLFAAETIDQALARGDCSAECLRTYEQKCAQLFRPRYALNSLIRFAIYRPALVDPLIRFLARHGRLLNSLVYAVCAPAAAR
jgi:geranylgeranyl reductase family protein